MHGCYIQTILVPQGAEYQAVCRGLSRVSGLKPVVVPIPVGSKPLTRFLQKWLTDERLDESSQHQVLVMGLCGSLNKRYAVGEVVLYSDYIYQVNAATTSIKSSDRNLTALLYSRLQQKAVLVKGLTSDRLIWSAAEKRRLAEQYNADVVDMEGFAIFDLLTQAGAAVSMVRVVSDDAQYNIPALDSAISPDGYIQPLSLASKMLRQPIAATRLIRGSLQGLMVLQKSAKALFV